MGDYGEDVLLLLIVGVSLYGWLQAILRRRAGVAVLPVEARLLVPWGLLDLALILAVVILVQTASQVVVRRLCGVQLQTELTDMLSWQQATVMVTAAAASVIALLVALLLVYFRSEARAGDLGLIPGKLAADLTLGTVAFAMLAPPVFGLQMLLTLWQPTTHPLIEMLRKQPDPAYLWVGIFAAVLVAPIVEECVFRVFLQGWLENAFSLTRRPPPPGVPAREIVTRFLIGGRTSIPPEADRGQVEPSTDAASVAGEPVNQLLAAFRPSWWPIFISAGLFALMHLGHGPDPIPLFVLAVGLGYLYQRTHRVFPCIVVHLLVNAFTMLQLWLYLHRGV